MTEPMVTDEDREIARRWLSEGQINVDQMGRAAVLVAIRQEYQAALAEQDAEIERLRAALDEAFIQGLENAADIAKGERIEGILRSKVERLRAEGAGAMSKHMGICEEAAAEITRLRAALAAERERCARVADDRAFQWVRQNNTERSSEGHEIAAAIRARGS